MLQGRMQERNVLKLALLCSIVGLFLLYVLSDTLDLSESMINALDEKGGEGIRVIG